MVPEKPSDRLLKWNVERGLIRGWVLFAVIWTVVLGAVWLVFWSHELAQIGNEFAPAPNYDALCAKLRAERAAGSPVDPIPAIPALELVVENGVGRVVAAPGRCLVVLAKEAGIDLVPVALRIVGGDGSKLQYIQDREGNRRPIADFRPAPTVIRMPDRSTMFFYLALILGVPAILFARGSGAWSAVVERSDYITAGILQFTGFILIIACPITFAWQCFYWLRWGNWHSILLHDAFGIGLVSVLSSTEWLGVNKLVNWIFGAPFSIAVLIIGAAIWGIGALVFQQADEARRRASRDRST